MPPIMMLTTIPATGLEDCCDPATSVLLSDAGGWAFVSAARDYANVLDAPNGVPNVPPARQIGIARFAYCTN